eukprot:1826365-Amphidinium_carterae.1
MALACAAAVGGCGPNNNGHSKKWLAASQIPPPPPREPVQPGSSVSAKDYLYYLQTILGRAQPRGTTKARESPHL